MKNINLLFGLILLGSALGLNGCAITPTVVKDSMKEDSYVTEINRNQPIAVGEEIYKAESKVSYREEYGIWALAVPVTTEIPSVTTKLTYYYLGSENNILKIKERISQYKKDKLLGLQDEFLTLPLDVGRQAFLRVKTLSQKEQPKELTITVDDRYRIKVKEYGIGDMLGTDDPKAIERARKSMRYSNSSNNEMLMSCISMGQAAASRKEYDEAVNYLKNAIKLDPDSTSAHYNLGCVLAEKGNEPAAMEECNILNTLGEHHWANIVMQNIKAKKDFHGELKKITDLYISNKSNIVKSEISYKDKILSINNSGTMNKIYVHNKSGVFEKILLPHHRIHVISITDVSPKGKIIFMGVDLDEIYKGCNPYIVDLDGTNFREIKKQEYKDFLNNKNMEL